jgi:hypothetical protein
MYTITVTITGKKEEFDAFLSECNGKRFYTIKREDITSWGVEGMVCTFTQEQMNHLYPYETLMSTYPSLLLKIEWKSGANTGISVCQSGRVQHMEWIEDDLCFRSH